MDRGNITLFAESSKTGTNALGYRPVISWQYCFTFLILVTKDAGVYLVLLKEFYVFLSALVTVQAALPKSESSGGNFVIYSPHSRVVTALYLLLSEPTIGREMGSEHSISDTPFIWVDTEQQSQRP